MDKWQKYFDNMKETDFLKMLENAGFTIQDKKGEKNKMEMEKLIITANEGDTLAEAEPARTQRLLLGLDEKDLDGNQYEIVFPQGVRIMLSRYFRALFGQSLNTLGEEGFRQKYQFSYREYGERPDGAPQKDVMRECIESGIKLSLD
jgi:hypothetical protein